MMPGELVIEIISRLPTKSLSRFRCVSEDWNNLVSCCIIQRKIFLPMAGFLTYPRDPSECTQEFFIQTGPYPPRFEEQFKSGLKLLSHLDSYVSDSCNGLVLFTNVNCKPLLYDMWNPATEEIVSLPEPPETDEDSSTYSFLAFDPCRSPHYKVVRFDDACRGGAVTVDIYSSLTESWAEFVVPIPKYSLYSFDQESVFRQGAIHMLTGGDHLLRFETEKSSFDLIRLPEERIDSLANATDCIGLSKGNLYYAVNFITKFEFRIYMYGKGSKEKWLLTHKTDTIFFMIIL